MKTILSIALAAGLPLAAFGDAIPNGTYTGRGDGSTVSRPVNGSAATSTTAQPGHCSGGGAGRLEDAGNERWRVVMSEYGACTVNIRKAGAGYDLEEEASGQCSAYHGATCHMIGTVQAAKAPATGERQARCKLVVSGKTYIDGACLFRPMSGDGSFSIIANAEDYFAYVNKTPDGMRGSWNEEAFAGHAHTDLGILQRDGACWNNTHAQVCAW
jgi:hypothetical protein